MKPTPIAKPDSKEVAKANRKNNGNLRKANAEIKAMLKDSYVPRMESVKDNV